MRIAEAPYVLWVSDKDDEGKPVDPDFVAAAYALEPTLFQYRHRELGCQSMTASLVQSTVNAASRAAHSKPVKNPIGYLYRAFTRKVDRHLARQKHEIGVKDDFIEDLGNRISDRSATEIIDNRILLAQLKFYMDEWTRNVCSMRIMGYSNEEIGNELGLPANTVAVRFSRGLCKAAHLLLSSSSNERRSRG